MANKPKTTDTSNSLPKAAPAGQFFGTPQTIFPQYSMFGAGSWTGLPPAGAQQYTNGGWSPAPPPPAPVPTLPPTPTPTPTPGPHGRPPRQQGGDPMHTGQLPPPPAPAPTPHTGGLFGGRTPYSPDYYGSGLFNWTTPFGY